VLEARGKAQTLQQRRVHKSSYRKRGVCNRHGASLNTNSAAVMDAQILLSKEECAEGRGGQRSNITAANDAQINLRKEDCGESKGQTFRTSSNRLLA